MKAIRKLWDYGDFTCAARKKTPRACGRSGPRQNFGSWTVTRWALWPCSPSAPPPMAGPEKYARFAAAFDWRWSAAETAPFRIDAWIDPPAYTGKPPIVLPMAPSSTEAPITAPIGSTVIVRAVGDTDLRVAVQGGILPAAPDPAATPNQRRFMLGGDGSLRISRGAKEVGAFSLRSLPDAPPTITPLEPPQPNLAALSPSPIESTTITARATRKSRPALLRWRGAGRSRLGRTAKGGA